VSMPPKSATPAACCCWMS